MIGPSRRITDGLARLAALIGRHWRNRFYLYVAAAFSVFVVVDAAVLHLFAQMRQSTFDAMVRYRVSVPRADPGIIIVDINEASLAAMSPQYGRWPWPRQVLGEFLEGLEQQHPQAVVFDILFSDPDIYNPDSDTYFDTAIAATSNTYFPYLRLDEASDPLSQVKPGMIPGVVPIAGEAQEDATVAVVLPHFRSALKGGRLGFYNVYADPDGTVREYLLDRVDYGWELPSLPLRVGRGLGWKEPDERNVLLNWRGAPFSYRYVTFSDVFDDMGRRAKRRPQDEFTGKVVLIGSTAAGLFDFKPSPVSRIHPGVEILATALDNVKHQDYLRFPEGRVVYPLLALGIVWATAWSFYRDTGREKIDRLFGASQFILIGVSYASINLSTTYINLTGPAAVGIAFFTVARIYAAATYREMERSMVRYTAEHAEALRVGLLLIRTEGLSQKALDNVRRKLERMAGNLKSVEVLKGQQKGVWSLLEGALAVSWVVPAKEGAARIIQDAQSVIRALPDLLRRYPAATAVWQLRHSAISGGERATDAWRGLLAETLLDGSGRDAMRDSASSDHRPLADEEAPAARLPMRQPG